MNPAFIGFSIAYAITSTIDRLEHIKVVRELNENLKKFNEKINNLDETESAD